MGRGAGLLTGGQALQSLRVRLVLIPSARFGQLAKQWAAPPRASQAFADRFLTPGAPGDIESRDGHGFVQGESTNAKRAKFINYYWFAPCQSKLVLYIISENPQ